MKTICPYCKQEYPDTPDEYLDMKLECPVCNRSFIAQKAKFCSECGASSPGQAITCHKCGKFFPEMPQQRPAPTSVQNYAQEDIGFFTEYDESDCFVEDIDLFTPWRKWRSVGSRGRSCRKEYWFFLIGYFIAGSAGTFLAYMTSNHPIVYVLNSVFGLVSIPVYGSLNLRRKNDIGISRWWGAMFLIPLACVGVGAALDMEVLCIIFVILAFACFLFIDFFLLLFWPSQPGENKYGPNPVGDPGGHPYRKLNAGSMLIGIGITGIILILLYLLIRVF